ncbi:Rcn2 [Kluyveromyces lactis]|nr:Rcn2 [Kluyveromyces lactis]
MGQPKKTQILVTDLDSDKFNEGWPRSLEETLFQKQFPHITPEYYSPLPFLHRIVIILSSEDEAVRVFQFVQNYVREALGLTDCKVYLTESLISKPRSKSVDDKDVNSTTSTAAAAAAVKTQSQSRSQTTSDSTESSNHSGKKPVLKVNTSYSSSSVTQSEDKSNTISSPSSLSPEQPLSPTKVKLRDDQEEYFYMEPAPQPAHEPTITSANSNIKIDTPVQAEDLRNKSLQAGTAADSDSSIHPRSPSITITSMF